MLSLETWIGLRYLRAKKRSGFMSFISTISIIGIAIGVIALIVVLSVMNGFQREIRGQLLKVAPHMEIGYFMPEAGDNWQNLAALAQKNPRVLGVSPFVAGQALLANEGEVSGVQLKGIDPNSIAQVSEFGDKLPAELYRKLLPTEFDLVLGQELAAKLGAQIGQKITVITPDGNVTPVGMVPRMKQFNVVGIVHTGIFAVDSSLALTNIEDAKTLYRAGDENAILQVRLSRPDAAPEVTAVIVPPDRQDKVWARDWTFQNKDYFQAVELEKKMMFIIMFFISLVASINLISTLIMTVTEKRAAIAILRTLGLSPRKVMHIFMVQGIMLGLIGTVSGVVIGVLLAWNIGHVVHGVELLLGRQLISSAVYFIDYVPSHVAFTDVAIIAGISLLLSFLVTLYPSRQAAKTQPAEALRYE
ncbi:lipoprotein-releasing ABC transporter permease subunit [Stenoxybacter acetivorans]|uniref:lipoprotein-releasing ABC transporter permease subunit n=1 Tax=Stenoxybacter acetivorans TaxID=422441 RepID=UPI000568D184|nr:lipoprotein-releasing ABC transporter permease subunit [Stenoxybacter acetivorans]